MGSQPKYENVNKKAIDQFTTFMEQLQELNRKRTELDESLKSIKDFMKKVDEQKEETLNKTLEEVNRHFGQIFGELVRGVWAKSACCKLAIRRRARMSLWRLCPALLGRRAFASRSRSPASRRASSRCSSSPEAKRQSWPSPCSSRCSASNLRPSISSTRLTLLWIRSTEQP